MENNLNYLSLALSTIIPMVVGFIYYHPKVAGTIWMQANGFTLESLGKGPKPIMFLVALVLSFLLSMFVNFNVTGPGQEVAEDGHSYVTFQHGIVHGIILTVVFVAPILGTMGIFEKKSMKWFLVNIGYWLITLCIMAGILSAWR